MSSTNSFLCLGRIVRRQRVARKFSKLIFGILSAIATLSLTGAARANLIGNTFGGFANGALFDVNQSTGLASNGRLTGIKGLIDVAYAPNGTLYGMSTPDDPVAPNSLFTINPVTGASTLVGSTGLSNIIEGDLAFQPGTGALFGIYDYQGGSYRLFTLNLTTGAATIVGNIGSTPNYTPSDPSGMAFAPDGSLYIIDPAFMKLVKINPATAAVISSVNLVVDYNEFDPLGVVVGFDFDPVSGVGYVVDGAPSGFGPFNAFLNTLNTSTGELTPVGQTFAPGGLAGLAFSPAVPEPASASLMLVGAITALSRRRRR